MGWILNHWVFAGVLFVAIAASVVSLATCVFRNAAFFKLTKIRFRNMRLLLTGLVLGYALFLGMTISNSKEYQRQVKSVVNKEAYLAEKLIQLSNNFPKEKRSDVTNKIRSYLNSVAVDEWPLLGTKKVSLKTTEKYEQLLQSMSAYNVSDAQAEGWFSILLGVVSEFNHARFERLNVNGTFLGPSTWIALVFGAIVVVFLLFFFRTESVKAQVGLNIFLAGSLASLLYCTALLERPFAPSNKITPKVYELVCSCSSSSQEEIRS